MCLNKFNNTITFNVMQFQHTSCPYGENRENVNPSESGEGQLKIPPYRLANEG